MALAELVLKPLRRCSTNCCATNALLRRTVTDTVATQPRYPFPIRIDGKWKPESFPLCFLILLRGAALQDIHTCEVLKMFSSGLVRAMHIAEGQRNIHHPALVETDVHYPTNVPSSWKGSSPQVQRTNNDATFRCTQFNQDSLPILQTYRACPCRGRMMHGPDTY